MALVCWKCCAFLNKIYFLICTLFIHCYSCWCSLLFIVHYLLVTGGAGSDILHWIGYTYCTCVPTQSVCSFRKTKNNDEMISSKLELYETLLNEYQQYITFYTLSFIIIVFIKIWHSLKSDAQRVLEGDFFTNHKWWDSFLGNKHWKEVVIICMLK